MKQQTWEEAEKRKEEERRSEKRKRQKKEDAGERKGRQVAKHCVLPMFCGPGGLTRTLAKAAGAERREATCRRQNGQNTSTSEHFWKLRR